MKPRCWCGLGSKTFLRSFLHLLSCYLLRGLKQEAGSSTPGMYQNPARGTTRDCWPHGGIAEPPAHSLGGPRRCLWLKSSNSRKGRDEHGQQKPRSSGSSPCPARQGEEYTQEQATGKTSNKPPALHPCQHQVAFTGCKKHISKAPQRAQQQDSCCTSFH